MDDKKNLIIGFLIGFMLGTILCIMSLNDWSKIYKSDNGWFVTDGDIIYQLVEVKAQ
jgi:heme/copper-type cytochrome/quinol oxidase subunit 3